MSLNELTARAILEAAHSAWSNQDLDSLLSWYADDLVYYCNTGAPDGGPLELHGKADLRAFLLPVIAVADSASVLMHFDFRSNIGRAQVECFLRHRQTGNVLTATYRQAATYEGDKIIRLEEFHDAAMMKAFWALVLHEGAVEEPTKQLTE